MTNVDLTDIRPFVFSWLPSALRGNISELACVLAGPFHGIHQRYLDYKREKTYLPWLLNYNWSVKSMEEMLNNYFEIDSSNLPKVINVKIIAEASKYISFKYDCPFIKSPTMTESVIVKSEEKL